MTYDCLLKQRRGLGEGWGEGGGAYHGGGGGLRRGDAAPYIYMGLLGRGLRF